MIWLRRSVQFTFFVFFIFLLINTRYTSLDTIPYPVKIFLNMDPLVALSVLITRHSVSMIFILSFAIALMTILLGRFFCGWICPLGTFFQWTSYRKKISNERALKNLYHKWARIKYLILFFILTSALFSFQVVGFFDPLCLFIRTLSLAVFPSVDAIFEIIHNFLSKTLLANFSYAIYAFLKEKLLSFKPQMFFQGFVFFMIFLILLIINRLRTRFWCRVLCPLGAFLGIFSWLSRLTLNREINLCKNCDICSKNCQGAAEPHLAPDGFRKAECLLCYNCISSCKTRRLEFNWSHKILDFFKSIPPDLEKRKSLYFIGAGFLTGLCRNFNPLMKLSSPMVIRPPGSIKEEEFLSKCIKCGECMRVCLTNAIQPSLFEAGLEGLWSPVLNMRIGYCEYYCTLCGQVCPTGAIRKLSEKQKTSVKIGIAFIDVSRCLPYAFGKECIVCEEHCPTPHKAIWFEQEQSLQHDGTIKIIKKPKVDPELCIGCGICEFKCPVKDKRAIRITSVGESRSETNRMFLSDFTG